MISGVICDRMQAWIPSTSKHRSSATPPLGTSNTPAIAVLQDQAKRWLEFEAPKYRLVTSQFVIDEATRGDPGAAQRRLSALQNVGLLLPDPEIEAIEDKIVSGCMMPPKAKLDALHVASALLAGVEYLLTQNCRTLLTQRNFQDSIDSWTICSCLGF